MSTPTVDVSALLGEFLTGLPPADTMETAPVRHAAIVSAAVATVRAGLEPRFRELQHDEADRFRTEPGWMSGDGVAVMCAMGMAESILDALTDVAALMAGGRTTGVWVLLGHAGERLRGLHSLVTANPGLDVASVVAQARAAEIDMRGMLLDVFEIPHEPLAAADAGCCFGDLAVRGTVDPTATSLIERITAGARAATSVLPAQVTDPTVDADRVDYRQVAACTTTQVRLALDLLDLAAGTVCEFLDDVCVNPWWLPIADDVASALAAARDQV